MTLRELVRKRLVAGDEIAEDRVLLLADRLVEARGGSRSGLDLERLLKGETCLLGDLGQVRLARQLRPEVALGALHLLHALDDVHGNANRSRLVGDRPRDRLANPPGRVRRELEASLPLELLDGTNEAEHALLDQVE